MGGVVFFWILARAVLEIKVAQVFVDDFLALFEVFEAGLFVLLFDAPRRSSELDGTIKPTRNRLRI